MDRDKKKEAGNKEFSQGKKVKKPYSAPFIKSKGKVSQLDPEKLPTAHTAFALY